MILSGRVSLLEFTPNTKIGESIYNAAQKKKEFQNISYACNRQTVIDEA